MDIMLVLNNQYVKNCRIIVNLKEKKLKQEIISLLERDRNKEAFDILMKRAEVRQYVPENTQPPKRPMLITFNEDLL